MFAGVGHNLPNPDTAAEVYRPMRDWFTKHGVLKATVIEGDKP